MASTVLVNGTADVHAQVQADLDGPDGFSALEVFNQVSAARRRQCMLSIFICHDRAVVA